MPAVYRDFYVNEYKFCFFVEGRDNYKDMWDWLDRNRINYTHEWGGGDRNGFSIPIHEEESLLLFKLTWGIPQDFMAKT